MYQVLPTPIWPFVYFNSSPPPPQILPMSILTVLLFPCDPTPNQKPPKALQWDRAELHPGHFLRLALFKIPIAASVRAENNRNKKAQGVRERGTRNGLQKLCGAPWTAFEYGLHMGRIHCVVPRSISERWQDQGSFWPRKVSCQLLEI